MTGGISVLHVDDDPALVDLTATFLERENEHIDVTTATSASEGLAQLGECSIDCIISDYDMPETNGLEFLETVRGDGFDLPFILFTGKGSEEIASEAISAGVTDYLQKQPGVEQYTMLANRIENAVSRHRAQAAQDESEARYRTLIEHLPVGVIVHRDNELVYANDAAATLVGADDAGELEGRDVCSFVAQQDRQAAAELLSRSTTSWVEFDLESPDGPRTVEAVDSPIVFNGRPATQLILREVTDEHRLRKGLTRAQTRYRAALEVTADAMMVLNQSRHEVVDTNAKACDLLGVAREDLLGRAGPDLCPPDHRPTFEDLLGRCEVQRVYVEELAVANADGEAVPVTARATAAQLGDDQLIYLACSRR